MAESPRERSAVRVKWHQEYEVNLRLRLFPPGKSPSRRPARCRPRRGGERIDKDPLELPDEIEEWIAAVGDEVIEWLARDEGRRWRFLSDPLDSLIEAGVEPSRAHLKAISQARRISDAANALPAGLRIGKVGVEVERKGIVRPPDPAPRSWSPPKLAPRDGSAGGCGCEQEGE